jgi:hypothetical protein
MSETSEDRSDSRRGFDDRYSAAPVADEVMPDQIARFAGTRPLYVLPNAWGARLSAARWNFSGLTTLKSCALRELVLGFRAAGSATIVRSLADGSMRKRPMLGAVADESGSGRGVVDRRSLRGGAYLHSAHRVAGFLAQGVRQ